MLFHYLLAKGKPNARTLIFRTGMQPAEHVEYLFGILLIEPDAIVLDKYPAILRIHVPAPCRGPPRKYLMSYMDTGYLLLFAVLQGIVDQVREQRSHEHRIHGQDRQRIQDDL